MEQLSATAKNQGWLSCLTLAFTALRPQSRKRILDVRTLSDHLKRDMGFLDGNDTSAQYR